MIIFVKSSHQNPIVCVFLALQMKYTQQSANDWAGMYFARLFLARSSPVSNHHSDNWLLQLTKTPRRSRNFKLYSRNSDLAAHIVGGFQSGLYNGNDWEGARQLLKDSEHWFGGPGKNKYNLKGFKTHFNNLWKWFNNYKEKGTSKWWNWNICWVLLY